MVCASISASLSVCVVVRPVHKYSCVYTNTLYCTSVHAFLYFTLVQLFFFFFFDFLVLLFGCFYIQCFFLCHFYSISGGFAFVYVVQDVQSGNEYALKRLLGSDKQTCNNIIRELNMHKQLSGHSNIVNYVDASFINHANSAKAYAEYLLVSELCKGGSLIDCMGTSFEPDAILKIVYQITKAVGHMHNQNPPITHRDIKVQFSIKNKNKPA